MKPKSRRRLKRLAYALVVSTVISGIAFLFPRLVAWYWDFDGIMNRAVIVFFILLFFIFYSIYSWDAGEF